MRRLLRQIPLRYVVLLGAGALAASSSLILVSRVDNNTNRISTSQEDIRAIARVAADVTVQQCRLDRKFRVQYRQRGIVEERYLRIEEKVDRGLQVVAHLAARRAGGGTPAGRALRRLDRILRRATNELARLRGTIVIRPVPDCESIREAVLGAERSIAGNGPDE